MATRRFTIASAPATVPRTIRDAGRRHLPARYRTDLWDTPFRARLGESLRPTISILDLGAGRRPTVEPTARPDGVTYVGLDVDAEELALAEPGSYDETVVAPGEQRVPALEGRFDLVLSFFAFEHVESTAAVLDNLRAYLKPGGRLLAQLAGARSPFSLANRLLPGALAKRLLARTQDRASDTVFPARYDLGTATELERALHGWTAAEVVPLFTGAGYVLFSRVLTAAYIAYEERLVRGDHRDLAPYYLIDATR